MRYKVCVDWGTQVLPSKLTDLPEIPAGMLDGSGHFKGVAAEEIQVLFGPLVARLIPVARSDDVAALSCEEITEVGEAASESQYSDSYI